MLFRVGVYVETEDESMRFHWARRAMWRCTGLSVPGSGASIGAPGWAAGEHVGHRVRLTGRTLQVKGMLKTPLQSVVRNHNARAGVAIAWLCCLVPTGIVIVCTVWSMHAGLVPVCFPLIDGCLSISAACRSKPVIYLFRTGMFPMVILLIWFWSLNNAVLASWLPKRKVLRLTVLVLSITGSTFLAFYIGFLGTDGPVYEILRRLGIYVFFGATGFAQLLTTFFMHTSVRQWAHTEEQAHTTLLVWRIQCFIVVSMLLIGPLNLLLKEILLDSRRVENVIEWNFALAMFGWYGLQALLIRGQKA